MENNVKNQYFVIFGGGGIRGLSYCGAYKALNELEINITGYAGSSIGAVFAGLISVGYTYNEIFEMFFDSNLKLFFDFNFDFKKDFAFSKGEKFLETIREKIEQKFYKEEYQKNKMPPVRFSDIKNKLIIYSVDLTNLKFNEFSKEKTPDFEIAKAVRASVSMPGLFRPFEYDNKMIIDGDIMKALPMWRISPQIKNLKERIIEFRLEDNETVKNINTPLEYIDRVYNAICGFATEYVMDMYSHKDKFDYIKINTENISVVNFFISKEEKQNLFDTGYNRTKKYFIEIYPKKKKDLFEKYKYLLNSLIQFQKEFNKSNMTNSYLKLCEMFIFLCEQKAYLDSKIYDLIYKFKDKYLKNYHSVNFLVVKSAVLTNKEKLAKDLLEIIKAVTNKTIELE